MGSYVIPLRPMHVVPRPVHGVPKPVHGVPRPMHVVFRPTHMVPMRVHVVPRTMHVVPRPVHSTSAMQAVVRITVLVIFDWLQQMSANETAHVYKMKGCSFHLVGDE